MSSPVSVVQSRFLELPAELRNHIYRLALVDDQGIKITSKYFPEPAMLSTCKQAREEASPIFYTENRFEAVVQDYESDPYMICAAKATQLKRGCNPSFSFYVTRRGSPNWNKTINWLYKAHKHGLVTSADPRPGEGAACVAWGALFRTLHQLQRLEWTEVEKVMEELHRVLAAIDSRWL